MHAGAAGVHEHGSRAVEDVSGRQLAMPGLQTVLQRPSRRGGDLPVNGEDRTYRHVDVDVARSVERVVEEHVIAARELVRDRCGLEAGRLVVVSLGGPESGMAEDGGDDTDMTVVQQVKVANYLLFT